MRLFDVFVDSLDMPPLDFVQSIPKGTGIPGYDPRDLLKLYIYGYFYQIRSSRKLARECKCNLEVMWLLGKLYPDFRTIFDCRKDNKDSITKVLRAFAMLFAPFMDQRILLCFIRKVIAVQFWFSCTPMSLYTIPGFASGILIPRS